MSNFRQYTERIRNRLKSTLCALFACIFTLFISSNAYAVTCPTAFPYPTDGSASTTKQCYATVRFYPNGSTAYPAIYSNKEYTTSYKSTDETAHTDYLNAYYPASTSWTDTCDPSNNSTYWCKANNSYYYLVNLEPWETIVLNGTMRLLERPGWTLHVYTSGSYKTVWTKTKNGTDPVYNNSNSANQLQGATKLYAKWDANTYNISYTLNGGTNPTDQIDSYTVSDSLDITLKNPYRNGYTFAGWCDNSGLTTNCTTSKKITAGAYGDKTYYAKWTQITGTKTLKLFCANGDVKTKTFTGSSTYMQISDVATECSFTGDKRDIWVCGDLSGNSNDGYSVSNLRSYQYNPGTGARIGITSTNMFCSPALTVGSAQYTGSAASYLYYRQPGSYGDSNLLLRMAPLTALPLAPVQISSFCSTIQTSKPKGTTFWWYNPDNVDMLPTDSDYSKNHKFTTTYPTDLEDFATQTNTIAVIYGYKVGFKCSLNSDISKYIAYNGANGTEVSNLISTTRTRCNKGSSVPLYCAPNSDLTAEYQLTQPSGGGETVYNVFGENSTCYFKLYSCATGEYLNPNSSTYCTSCENGYYCPGGNFDNANSIQGHNSCPVSYFPHSAPQSSDSTDCFATVTKVDPVFLFNSSINVHKSTTTTNYVAGAQNYTLTSTYLADPTPQTGYTFNGYYTTQNYAQGAPITTSTTLVGDRTLYEKWDANTYTISYKCTNFVNDTNIVATDNRTYDTRYTDYLFRTYSDVCPNNGYNATQWQCSYNNTSEIITPTPTDPDDPADGVWQIPYSMTCVPYDRTAVSFVIHFDDNNPTTDDNMSVSGTKTDKTCTYDSATCDLANTPTNNGFNRTGFTFTGWNTSADGSGFAVNAAANSSPNALLPYISNGEVTLYAQWSANCMQKTLDGRRFETYNSPDSSGTGPDDPNWTYTLYVRYNDGIYSDSNCSTPLNASSISLPTYAGYTFGGFYDSKAGYTWQNITSDGQFTAHAIISVTNTWWAKWTPITINLTWDTGDGAFDSGTDAPTNLNANNQNTCTYGGDIYLPDNNPERTGYSFGGWSTTPQ